MYKGNKGYEILVEVPGGERPYVLCVDSAGTIRARYLSGCKYILSDSKRWMDSTGLGEIVEDVENIEVGDLVSALTPEGEPLVINQKEMTRLNVVALRTVNIGDITKEVRVRIP